MNIYIYHTHPNIGVSSNDYTSRSTRSKTSHQMSVFKSRLDNIYIYKERDTNLFI